MISFASPPPDRAETDPARLLADRTAGPAGGRTTPDARGAGAGPCGCRRRSGRAAGARPRYRRTGRPSTARSSAPSATPRVRAQVPEDDRPCRSRNRSSNGKNTGWPSSQERRPPDDGVSRV
ncbi:MAG: hypothetical protein M0C28_47650 [Candidatus Moduliflexus flocculans]|nr:hypothetical protein [Candidatus Moduliflexus flocculans]